MICIYKIKGKCILKPAPDICDGLCGDRTLVEKETLRALHFIFQNIMLNSESIDPKFVKIVDEDFWDLLMK